MEYATSASRTGIFKHQPLDHNQPSIRLIRVHQDLSSEGMIQCTVLHTTTDASYTCLSYRWGDLDAIPATILVNGKLLSVRQNLFEFLHQLRVGFENGRHVHMSGPYWIDALSIDQSNTSERNHQVAQMGRIFASARRVHVWLGRTSDAPRMRQLFQNPGPIMSDDWQNSRAVVLHDMELIGRYILHNAYWNRAWVTQEIILARRVVISLDASTFRLSCFLKDVRNFGLDLKDSPFAQFKSGQNFRNGSLLSLLGWFRDKECSIPHDRIYSLLSLCQEDDVVEVDYSVQNTDLAVQLLRKSDTQLCVCSAAVVASTLDLSATPRAVDGDNNTTWPSLKIDIGNLFILSSTLAWSVWSKTPNQSSCTRILMDIIGYIFNFVPERNSLKQYISDGWGPDYAESLELAPVLSGFLKTLNRHELNIPSDSLLMKYLGSSVSVCDESRNICTVYIPLAMLDQNSQHRFKVCGGHCNRKDGSPDGAVKHMRIITNRSDAVQHEEINNESYGEEDQRHENAHEPAGIISEQPNNPDQETSVTLNSRRAKYKKIYRSITDRLGFHRKTRSPMD